MKTAGRENQKRWLNEPASRDPERNARTILLKRGGLEAKKKSGHRRGVFFLTPFIELIRRYAIGVQVFGSDYSEFSYSASRR
jgi:hypothetical protein